MNILIHSCLYYRFDTSIISDHQYDQMCLDLVELQRDYPEESKACDFYYEAFQDWTGETGFHLPTGDPYVVDMAQYVLREYKKYKKRTQS